MELAGRVALITGGRRIGAAVATELARGGADIALVYRRSRAEAEETADTLREGWLTDERFTTVEVMVAPDTSVLVAAKR